MHNHYSYLYNKCVFELLEKHHGKGGAVVFARAGATVSKVELPASFRDLAGAAEWLDIPVDVLTLKDEPAPHI